MSVLSLRSTISFRLFFILSASILALFFLYMFINHRSRDRMTRDLVTEEAIRASSYIKQSLVAEMADKQRDHIQRAIEQLGAEPGMESIRVYNSRGEIRFSDRTEEIGVAVNLEHPSCRECHGRPNGVNSLPDTGGARIFEMADGARTLGIINPILNAPGCSGGGCHEADKRVLGILDVQVSLAEVDRTMSEATLRSGLMGLAIILSSALLIAVIVFNSVHVPARRLQRATEALAAGNLDVVIDLKRNDELGQLAESFNSMARSLKTAYAELRGWSATLEDRVREKTAEVESMSRQMIQVEKTASLGKMAATVAHELNNPLSGIVTYSKLAARKIDRQLPAGDDRDAVLEELDLIRVEAMRCGRIVKDLLTYARESPREFNEESLHSLIDRAVKLTQHHMKLGLVDLAVRKGLDDDRIVCDGDQVVQALLALMINAVEAMPDGGQLILETEPDPGDPNTSLLLTVSDTGCGIPDEIRERIFDPFFSTKPETKGVGLGLAVVYGIVHRHGGHILVESTQGIGTSFRIAIPRRPAAGNNTAADRHYMDEWRK